MIKVFNRGIIKKFRYGHETMTIDLAGVVSAFGQERFSILFLKHLWNIYRKFFC